MRGSCCAPKVRRRRKMQIEVLEDRQLLAAITVNTTADDATPDSTLSLREAIEVSNGTLLVSSLSAQEKGQVSGAVGASNSIRFNIPTTDPGYNPATKVWSIAVNTPLPTITTNAALIDGYSQPGALENTLAQGDNAKLAIAINGASHGASNGLTIAQQGSQVLGLDIENFFSDGVLITAGGNVQVAGCFIGTDPTGETAAPNGNGVVLENSFNTIGGPNVGDRNVISGNNEPGLGDGIFVPDQADNPLNITPTGNVIENNYIGLDATGTKPLANNKGVVDFGSGNTYGGTTSAARNVISGNSFYGIDATGNITIEGNYFGANAVGNAAVGNGATGIVSQGLINAAVSATISNNLVSGNGEEGIAVSPGSQSLSTYTIANNLIGTNAAGTAALGNKSTGLALDAVENATVLNNVISGNQTGVTLGQFGLSPEHNVFHGNLIGTDKTGLIAIGNTDRGINVGAAIGNLIGGTGPGQGNVIAFNGGVGIFVDGGVQDQFTQNSIFANGGVGIYFFSAKSNQFATPPALTFTPGSGGSGTLSGILNSTPNQTFTIEIFSNPTAPAAGLEQGKTFVQDVTVKTNGSGKGTFSVTEPTGFYTASATDPNGNSSTFSKVAGAPAVQASFTTVTSSLNPSLVGQPVTFTAVVSAPGFAGTPAGTVSFTIDGQAQPPVSLSVKGGKDEAQFVTSTLTAGPHTVTATYSGEANVSPSNGSLPTQAVSAPNLQPTTTTLVSSLNPSVVGQQVTFTAVVTAPGFVGTPAGTVTFSIDGQAQPPVSLSVKGGKDEAQFVTSTLTVGPHTVTATYSGDANVSPSNGSLPTQAVSAPNLEPTMTTVVSSLNPSVVGQPVTFTAVVTAPGFAGTPAGTVTFAIDGQAQAPVPLSIVGGMDEARFSTAKLTAGQHFVTASYSGDAHDGPSSDALPTQTVIAPNPQATTTTVTSSLNPSTVGQQVIFVAVVSPGAAAGTPTGTVTFTVDGNPQTPVPLQAVNGRELAALAVSTLTAGTHTIGATYSGNATFAPSTVASRLIQTVNALAPPGVDGPTVVSLQRFGIHMQPTVLVLTFHDGLNPTSASDRSNYRIVGPSGQSIPILSAAYDPTSNTVTILPQARINLHHSYQLTVIGTGPRGVTNSEGVLLDGAGNGRPGNNYTAPLNWSNVDLTPAEAKKYGHAKPVKPAGARSHTFFSRPR